MVQIAKRSAREPGESPRIALVFPPAMHPTGPPLGISSLKAYLSANSQTVVQNFDLNLAYYEQAVEWLLGGRLKVGLRKMDHAETAKRVTEARDFFRGEVGSADFFNLREYNRHAEVYTAFESVLNGLFDNFSRKILFDSKLPPLAEKFFEDLIEPLRSFRPDFIGFSILFSQQLFFALALSKLCRKMGVKTIFGGATFSVMPDPGRLLSGPVPIYLGKEPRTLDLAPLIDFLVAGEGEEGLKALVEKVRGSGRQLRFKGGDDDLSDVPGLIRATPSGPVRTPPRAVADLNRLPVPDFSDFPLSAYHSPQLVLPYLSSRGCPWRRCAFCTHQKTYLEYREEDVEVSAEKISTLGKIHGVSYFSLVDEMIHPRRLDRLCRDLSGNGTKIFFSAYARPAGGFSPELFSSAYRSGLRALMWGVESGSQRVLDLMRKGTDIAKVGEILRSAHDAGIWNLVFAIFGFPTETDSEWEATLDFLESHGEEIDALSKSRFVLLEGSDIFRDPARYGIFGVKDRLQKDPVSVAYDYETTEGLTREKIGQKFQEDLPRFSEIGRSPYFGRFRDHMLIFAAHSGGSPDRPR